MGVYCLSTNGVTSSACRPPFSQTQVGSRSIGFATTSVPVMSPCFLPIKLESCPPRGFSYRSSIWGATSLQYVSEFGTLSLLLLAPGLFRQGAEQRGKRNCSSRAYLEPTNPVVKFLNKVQGSLPVVGLIARLVSPEGGIGTDRIRFEEFCTRVGRNCTREASLAFYEFENRHGKTGKIPFVLIWCWAAAVGAGLLRSDDLLMGAARLNVSFDIQYEVENFDFLMDEATKKRQKLGSSVPDIPMEARAEKALEAICKCCTNRIDISEEDVPLLSTILKIVFPTADKEKIDLVVASRLFDPFNGQAFDSDVTGNMDIQEAADEQPQSLVQEFAQ